jgi:hypothetical protein
MGENRLRGVVRDRGLRRSAAIAGVAGLVIGGLAVNGLAVSGNIGTAAIQIDGGTPGADLYPGSGVAQNTGAALDWVQDSTGNVDTDCLTDSVASCNEAGVTAATSGVGHWNGARIVDGVGGAEQDIFLKGGKENDTSSWHVGPGSVGSSKYDATQAYLANNGTTLYFGMERRGNNGTTAFDFEFNQNASTDPNGYIPTRTDGDVLFTFEVSGSGSSGSVTPHIFQWDTNAYDEVTSTITGTLTSVNNVATPAAPWGYVNSHGNWVLGSLDRFEFAEAAVDLTQVFSGFSPCGAAPYFTQVRTRSSSTDTSDLKDTTKIFDYSFNPGAAPTASKSASAGTASTAPAATLTGVSDSGTTKQWQKSLTNNGSDWADIATATNATYTYTSSAFDTDVPLATAPVITFTDAADTSFNVSGTNNADGDYVGKVQTAYFRLKATVTVGGCESFSTPVTVTKIVAVDP